MADGTTSQDKRHPKCQSSVNPFLKYGAAEGLQYFDYAMPIMAVRHQTNAYTFDIILLAKRF